MIDKKILIISIFLMFISIGMVSASEDISHEINIDDQMINENLPIESISSFDLESEDIVEPHSSDLEAEKTFYNESNRYKKNILEENSNEGETLGTTLRPVDDSVSELTNIIDQAGENDIIELNTTYFISSLKVNKSLTFVGISDDAGFENWDTGLVGSKFFDIKSTDITLTFKNLNFVGGCDDGGSGGTIYSKSSLIFENCHFALNTANMAGAIYISGNSSELTLRNCVFEGNYVIDDLDSAIGGAIYSNCRYLSIENCSFKSNYVKAIEYDFVTEGAAIYSLNPCRIINSNFTDNSAGPVYGVGSVIELFADSIIEDCSFKNSTPMAIGIHNATLTLKNNGNVRNYTGNYNFNDNLDELYIKEDINNFTTDYNSSENFNITLFKIGKNVPYNGAFVEFKVFTDNTNDTYRYETYADENGTAYLKDTSLLSVGTHKVIIEHSSLQLETVFATAYITINEGDLQKIIDQANENDIIEINKSYDISGIKINKSLTFVGTSDNVGFYNELDDGKNFFNIVSNDSVVTFKNLYFAGGGQIVTGESYEFGGAINSKSTLNLENCIFNFNTGCIGGAIYITGNSSELNLNNCIFNTNYVSSTISADSGAIYSDCKYLSIDNCSFKNNYAHGEEYDFVTEGGAIYSLNPCKIVNSEFEDNKAGPKNGVGSVIELFADSIIEDCSFKNNTPMAIGVHNATLVVANNENITIHSGYFKLNDQLKRFSILDNIGNFTTTYESGEDFSINLFKEGENIPYSGAYVEFKVFNGTGSKTYETYTDENGNASLKNTSLLSIGTHKVIINHNSLHLEQITHTVYLTINEEDIHDDGNDSATIANATINLAVRGAHVIISLKDLDGKAISNASLKASIGNKNSTLTTNAKGQANLTIGENETAKISYVDVNGAVVSSSIVNNIVKITNIVAPNRTATRIIYNNMNTTAVSKADGRIGKYFKVKLVDANGKALVGKTIQIGFNGKVYNKTTNDDGSAKLQINLGYEGKYTFAIAFLGDDNYTGSFEVALIEVTKHTPKLTATAKSYKASAKTKTLTATFKSANGNAISGKKISFTINGNTYIGTTNAKGIATVKISLNKKGTYQAAAKYEGDGMYKATSTKFIVKIS